MSIAINIGANTNEPGFRGPVRADGSFEYVPIPESEPTARDVPTYGDLAPSLDCEIPTAVRDRPVHLDPEFPEHPFCERYTYGDEHGVKAGPLSSLSAGEYLFFYATLTVAEQDEWLPPDWGAFVIGQFRLARDPVTGEEYDDLAASDRVVFENNAHVKRETNDARVLLHGDPDESVLYDQAVPLSAPEGGTTPNWVVTDCSADSGKGPWWRRPLRFGRDETERRRGVTALAPPQVANYQY
jgi:hypothetical protein